MTSDHRPGKATVTRRVLLAAGGLALLGEFAAGKGRGVPVGDRAASAKPSGPAASPRPDRAASADARAAAARSQNERAAARVSAASPAPDAAHGSGPGHTPTASGQPMYYLDDGPMVIALTIDDGPSPIYTPQILSLLGRYGVVATFSMIGENVAAYPAIAREVAAAGHLIINHTWTHANLTELAPTAMADQISRASGAIEKATRATPAMFRAPFGAWSPAVLAQCRQMRLAPLDWSVDPRDWARPGVSAITTNIMRNTRSGSIILEHDGGGNRAQTVAALSYVLPRLLDAGYHFRTA
jgi:peptidoglycan/xylan/chitin deacetylase (PgdA/CDA1 family)